MRRHTPNDSVTTQDHAHAIYTEKVSVEIPGTPYLTLTFIKLQGQKFPNKHSDNFLASIPFNGEQSLAASAGWGFHFNYRE